MYKNLTPLYLAIFIGFLGYSLPIPLFPPMLLDSTLSILPKTFSQGMRTVILGVLLATYPLAQCLGSPFLGTLSDRFGRKRVLQLSLLVTTLAYIVTALSLIYMNIIWLFIGRFISGFSEGNIVIAQSGIADMVDEKRRNKMFGLVYLSASLAYVIGPLIGGKLASYFTYATPFWVVTALLILLIIYISFVFKETHAPDKREHVEIYKALTNFRKIFTEKKLRFFYLTNFFLYMSVFGFFRIYPIFITKVFHLDISRLSEIVAYVALPIIIVQLWVIGPLSKKFSPKQLCLISGLLLGLFLIIMVIPKTPLALLFTLPPIAFMAGICLPSCATNISVHADPNIQGEALGNNQSIQLGAEALSGALGGTIAALAAPLSLLFAALMALIGATLLMQKRFKKSA